MIKKNRGFSLLELLVVIGIIAILTALGTVSFTTAQKKSRDSKARSDLKEIQNALETYYSINGDYPLTADIGSDLDNSDYFSAGSRPTDTKTGDPYSYTSADGTSYCLCSYPLEVGDDKGNAADNLCVWGAGDYFCVSNLQ